MNKRFMSLLLVLVMVFSLLPISAMAQVFPVGDQTSMLEIKFFKGDTEINSQRTAKGSVSLYDPGCPVEGQEVFRGWKIQGQDDMLPVKAAEGEPSITAYVQQHYGEIESPLRVNAVMSHVRYLVYMDNKDRVLKTDFAREEDGYKTAVDFDYVPTAANEDLFGWATSKNATAASYHNGDEITLDKDKVELYPVCKAGYWLSFDNNLENQAAPINQDDTRATFTAPKLYFTGDPTQEPTAPTRPGYRLEGWYTDENLTQKYTFGQTLSDDLTLYAKWVPSGTVNYQVIIWKQKTTDDPNAGDDAKTYDYADGPSETRTAQAGTMVNIDPDDTRLVRDASRNITMGTNEKWNFFKYNANKTDTDSVLVKGDGTTVLNVYYDREKITFNFYTGSNLRTLYTTNYVSSNENPTHYFYPYPAGYYRVGLSDGPRGNWAPQTGDKVYSSVQPLWKKWQHKDGGLFGIGGQKGVIDDPNEGNHYTYISTADATGNYRMYEYTYSSAHLQTLSGTQAEPHGDENWNSGLIDPSCNHSSKCLYNFYRCTTNGLLYIFCRPGTESDHRYRAVYYRNEYDAGYYPVGTGPWPDAPATHIYQPNTQCSFTGLYGAEFHDWVRYDSNWNEIEWGLDGSSNTYPMPVLMFDNFDEGEASSGQATTMNLYPKDTTSGSTIHYQGQTVDGSGYEDFITFKSGGTWYPTEQFVGFTIKDYGPSVNGPWTGITSTGSFSTGQETWVRFTRHQSQFSMVSRTDSGETFVVNKKLYYETPLNVYGTSEYIPSEGPTGTYFDGWYADPGFTTPFDFNTTMPDNDVRVYAKWTTMRFRVVLDPINGAEGVQPTDISFGGNQVTTFRLDYGEKIGKNSIATATRDGYQLVGWYSDPNYEHPFNFDYATWDQIADLDYDTATDDQRQGSDPWNNDEPYSDVGEDDVVGKVVIYAKWRHVMGDNEYLTVAYDAAPGTLATADTNHYADMAQAIALPAPQAPAGFTFSYWQVMKPTSDTDTTLISSGVTVAPGNTYDVRLADAVNGVVTLKAVYAKSDTATHITWFGNGGVTAENAGVMTTDTEVNLPTDILSADTFSRPGYVFLGWARVNESDFQDGESWRQSDGTDVTDHLFLIWNENEQTYYVNHNEDNSLSPTEDVAVTQIAANELAPYHVLYAVWDQTDNHNYVIDYNGKMTIATSATAKKDDSNNNGAFNVADGNATYQLKNNEDSFANGANLAFNGIDTALINGVPVGSAAGATASWEKYTVIPANNVYFDDSLVEASMIAGDDNSIKAAVKANEDSPENGQEKTSLVFTFYGTGIDVYCTTDKDAGWIQANVDGTAYPFVNSRYQESEGSTTAIYNTPVISIDGLAPNVEHTLTLRTLTNSNFRLDGIRVYNPMQGVGDEATQATVNKAYDDADESNAVFLEVRDRILAANKFVVDGASDANIPDPITGAVFLETMQDGSATVKDYETKGPKDEVYLAPGQAIAFNLGGWFADTYKVMVGLSMPKSTDTGSATVYASGRGQSNPITVSARTDMFYRIYPDESGNVIIKNNGAGMISVTKLKITTIAADGTAYTVPAQTTGEAVEPGTRGLQVNRSLMAYAMAFDPATEVSPTDNVEEPDTPEEPDDPKPGWNDGAFNPMSILKNLFQNLLDGLGKLFGNLPKW